MGVAYDLNALSGINAASNGLGVISNNLANSQTVGFKSSRAEFADMFSGPQNSAGNGVRVAAITQDFSQGTLAGTGRELDMAIDGEGFFVLEDKSGKYDAVYSRNGSFKLDKDGFLTSQEGNRVQGYLLNETLSTETDPVFDTTLGSIDLDALNREPKATDQMNFDINLDGEADANFDPSGDGLRQVLIDTQRVLQNDLVLQLTAGGIGAASANAAVASALNAAFGNVGSAMNGAASVGAASANLTTLFDNITVTVSGVAANVSAGDAATYAGNVISRGYEAMATNVENILQMIEPERNGTYGGFPDFSTTKTIHDSLGGEHRLTANYYKRDVVEVGNSDIGEKYTSWLVQYTVEDFNEETQAWETSGHRLDSASGLTTESGQVFEVRFDTNGELIDVRMPTSDGLNYDSGAIPTAVVGPGFPLGSFDETNPTAGGWASMGSEFKLDFMIDDPLTGANDPLGNPDDPLTVGINVDFSDMTQFAGSNNLRGVSQNGFQIGDLVGLTTSLDGTISARYSNGRSIPVAQIALATFPDKNAMEKLGGQTYAESFSSGTVQLGSPQSNGFGTIQSGSLEYSNVDVAGELVNMIQTQRTYQASAQVISTSQQLTQTILQL